jgi:hypothetical protein
MVVVWYLWTRCPRAKYKEVAAMAILGIRKSWLERNARSFDSKGATLQQVLHVALDETLQQVLHVALDELVLMGGGEIKRVDRGGE